MTSATIPLARQVMGFQFTRRESQILMIRKNRPDWMAGKLNVIGGHVEFEESPVQAMVREFEEETGVTTTEADWGDPFCWYSSNHATELFMFAREVPRKSLCPAESETEEPVEWISFRRLTENIVPNLRWLVPMAWYHLSHTQLHAARIIEGADADGGK